MKITRIPMAEHNLKAYLHYHDQVFPADPRYGRISLGSGNRWRGKQ